MRPINLINVTPGMTLGQDIYSFEGTTLLIKGVTLTSYHINRLKQYGFLSIYIDDEISNDIELVDVINHKTRSMAKNAIMQAMNDLQVKKDFEVKNIKLVINNLIDEILSSRDIMINLSDLRTVDEYTFGHSVNVAILSMVIGKAIGLNELRLRDLGVGAILHDIGKTQVPNHILNKPESLNDEEFKVMKAHAFLGYELLKKYDDLSSLSKGAVLFHHERLDGSGYPFGKKDDDIHQFARIVAITDTYDAMTSNRIYRTKVSNGMALEYLVGMGNCHYDCDLVKVFMNHINIYPIGSMVKLNNGQKAIIIDNNKDAPTRPVVRIVLTGEEKKRCFEEIDLQKKLNIIIEEVCDE